jgi:hypothetical protein
MSSFHMQYVVPAVWWRDIGIVEVPERYRTPPCKSTGILLLEHGYVWRVRWPELRSTSRWINFRHYFMRYRNDVGRNSPVIKSVTVQKAVNIHMQYLRKALMLPVIRWKHWVVSDVSSYKYVRAIGYPDVFAGYAQSRRENRRKSPRTRHDCFLPNLFRFIIPQSS